MERVAGVFHRLRAAAGFSEEEVFLDPTPNTRVKRPDGFYKPLYLNIELTQVLLDCLERDEDVLDTLSHEIGHRVQDEYGMLQKKAPKDIDKTLQRRLEGQADHIGRELAELAGFELAAMTRSREIFKACGNIPPHERANSTHPRDSHRERDAARHVQMQDARRRALAAAGASLPGFHSGVPAPASAAPKSLPAYAAPIEQTPRPRLRPRYVIPPRLALENFNEQGQLLGFDGAPQGPAASWDCLRE